MRLEGDVPACRNIRSARVWVSPEGQPEFELAQNLPKQIGAQFLGTRPPMKPANVGAFPIQTASHAVKTPSIRKHREPLNTAAQGHRV
jgi:hypothetical protein